MAQGSAEQYAVPEGVDNSFAGLQARLIELQPSLRQIMSKGLELFEDVYPQALHPAQDRGSPVHAVDTVNFCPIERVPMGRELTIVLGSGKWIKIFRNTDSCPDEYPRKRIRLSRPEGDVNRTVNIIRTHNPRRIEYPYDVETVDYDSRGTCVGFVNGAAYYKQEPFVAEVDVALDDARQIAEDQGFLLGA